jgi:hypothetical protein
MANVYSRNVNRIFPAFLSPPPFPDTLFDSIKDPYDALQIPQRDLNVLRHELDEQCRDISAKVGTVRGILASLNRAKARVNRAFNDIGRVSEQRKRLHADLLREDYGLPTVQGKRLRVLLDVPDDRATLPDGALRYPVRRCTEPVGQQNWEPHTFQMVSFLMLFIVALTIKWHADFTSLLYR